MSGGACEFRWTKTVPETIQLTIPGLPFEREQMPQVVEIRHFRME